MTFSQINCGKSYKKEKMRRIYKILDNNEKLQNSQNFDEY